MRNAVCVAMTSLQPRVSVGEPPAQGAEQNCWPDLRDEHPRRPPRVAGAVVEQPHERRRLHPRPDERHDLPEEVPAVVPVPKRAEGGIAKRGPQPRRAGSLSPPSGIRPKRRFLVHEVVVGKQREGLPPPDVRPDVFRPNGVNTQTANLSRTSCGTRPTTSSGPSPARPRASRPRRRGRAARCSP